MSKNVKNKQHIAFELMVIQRKQFYFEKYFYFIAINKLIQIPCGPAPVPEKGTVNVHTKNNVFIGHFQCDIGYKLKGPASTNFAGCVLCMAAK